MMDTNDVDVVALLAERCSHSTQAKVAHQLGISKSYLTDVLAKRREPGPKILWALGLKRITRYRLSVLE